MLIKKLFLRIIPLLLFLTLLLSLVRVYKIEDISMHPALMDGDYVIVENMSAGIHVPAFFGYIDEHLYDRPEGIRRGDILAFKHPLDERLYIKRCAALPGDSVMQRNKIFYLQIGSNANQTRRYALKYALKTATVDGEYGYKHRMHPTTASPILIISRGRDFSLSIRKPVFLQGIISCWATCATTLPTAVFLMQFLTMPSITSFGCAFHPQKHSRN